MIFCIDGAQSVVTTSTLIPESSRRSRPLWKPTDSIAGELVALDTCVVYGSRMHFMQYALILPLPNTPHAHQARKLTISLHSLH